MRSMGQNRVDYFVQNGVAFSTQVGSDKEPAITRWTSWGPGDLQQSYLLHTTEGTLVVDPVLPGRSDSLQELKRCAGKVAAIVSLNPLHERHIAEAGRRYRAPVYGPTSAKKTTKLRSASQRRLHVCLYGFFGVEHKKRREARLLRKAPLTVGRDASRDRIDPHR
jgi:hypothetical protein